MSFPPQMPGGSGRQGGLGYGLGGGRAPRSAQSQLAYMQKKSVPEGGVVDPEQLLDWEEIAKHTTRESAWMVLGGKVYDITDYLDVHPGGSSILLSFCGKDATAQFNAAHRWVNFQNIIGHRQIGRAPPPKRDLLLP